MRDDYRQTANGIKQQAMALAQPVLPEHLQAQPKQPKQSPLQTDPPELNLKLPSIGKPQTHERDESPINPIFGFGE